MGKANWWERGVAAVFVAGLLALLIVNTALGSRAVAGNLVIDFELDSAPDKLPRFENTPISFWGSGSFGTGDGSVPPPLQRMLFEIDKFGSLETRGLPKCTVAKLEATTAPQARQLCPGAVVGTGRGAAVIAFPEQAPLPASTPLTFFNGPKVGGDPTVIVHAHLTIPSPTTYLVPMRIEHIEKGVYGFRVESKIPPIAGGYGSITGFRFHMDRKWQFGDSELSYINARCQIGRLQARIETEFVDDTILRIHYVHPCQVR
jgi:hypothetical protein